MLSLIARGLGTSAILYLSYLGAERVICQVYSWKIAYDEAKRLGDNRGTPSPR